MQCLQCHDLTTWPVAASGEEKGNYTTGQPGNHESGVEKVHNQEWG